MTENVTGVGRSMAACSSFRPGGMVCADGFVQKAFCSGRAGCSMCGAISGASLPHCLKEEIPNHHLNPDGSPLFYPAAAKGSASSRSTGEA